MSLEKVGTKRKVSLHLSMSLNIYFPFNISLNLEASIKTNYRRM